MDERATGKKKTWHEGNICSFQDNENEYTLQLEISIGRSFYSFLESAPPP